MWSNPEGKCPVELIEEQIAAWGTRFCNRNNGAYFCHLSIVSQARDGRDQISNRADESFCRCEWRRSITWEKYENNRVYSDFVHRAICRSNYRMVPFQRFYRSAHDGMGNISKNAALLYKLDSCQSGNVLQANES